METVRINKFLSEKGICSRREADRLITDGKILINGRLCEPGQKIKAGDRVTVNGRSIDEKEIAAPELLAFYKPRGIICTSSDKDRAQNIIDYIGYKTRLFTVGRLDKDSEGLILLTNRGELVNLINRSGFEHEKEYIVRCERRITDRFIKRLSQGVEIKIPVEDRTENKINRLKNEPAGVSTAKKYRLVKTKPCRVMKVDDYTFDIVITQGMNRQIRRMCGSLGNTVQRLKRVRVMNIELGNLKEGQYRNVAGKELKELERTLGLLH